MPPSKSPAFPHRKASTTSERDFFDIPDESCLAVVKRQLRHLRTWVFLALCVLLILWLRRERPKPPPLPHIRYDLVDWSRYAYAQYATASPYLCNSVMVFEALHRLGSRADRVLFYPEDWDNIVDSDTERNSQLLRLAEDKYKVQTVPIDVQMVKGGTGMADQCPPSGPGLFTDCTEGPPNPGTRASPSSSRSARPSMSESFIWTPTSPSSRTWTSCSSSLRPKSPCPARTGNSRGQDSCRRC